MAEEEEGGKVYQVVTSEGVALTTSKELTGLASAAYTNGDSYDGYFENGVRHGSGCYLYMEGGHKYDGDWKTNVRHGIGCMTYNNKGQYQGYWENGRRHGEGVFTYTSGDTYSGWWRFGVKEGTGTYVQKSTGMKLYGQWANGEIKTGRWIQ